MPTSQKGSEFFYEDEIGKKQDSSLHEAILTSGDHKRAAEVSKAHLRQRGWSEAEINQFLGAPKL